MKRVGGFLLFGLLLLSRNLAAQDTTDASPYPWRTSYFPYLTGSPNDGIMGLWRLVYFRQARFEDRVSLRDALSVEAGYSSRKSWLIKARGDFPRIADGWRIQADAQIGHTARFGNPESWQQRDIRNVNVEITRRLFGPLQFAARLGFEHLEHRVSLSDSYTLYPATYTPIPCLDAVDGIGGDGHIDACSPTITQSDRQARVALVLDLRDREFDTNNGVLIEGGLFTGSAEDGYTGGYGYARAWKKLRESTRLTARAGFRAMSRTGAIGIQHMLPAWENPVLTFGGPKSQRGLGMGEEPGRGLLLAGIEVRQEVKRFVNGLASITMLGFVDGGRAFRDPSPLYDPYPGAPIPSGKLRLTLDDWQVSVGAGLSVRVLKDASLNLTAAHQPGGGVRWYVSSGWAW